jgi:hypothetical protein
MLSFKDFLVVDYTPGMPDQVSYNAMKRKRGRIGEEVESTDEALDFSQRRARARQMKKYKAKIAMGRRRAAKKPADMERLKKRADKQARTQIFKKLSKGVDKGELPPSRRKEIETRLDKMKPRIQKIARKILPKVRKMDRERRMAKSGGDSK